MPIKLKGGPRDGEEVPDTLAGNEFTSTTRPPTPSSRPPRRDQAAVTLTYRRTTKNIAEYVGSLPAQDHLSSAAFSNPSSELSTTTTSGLREEFNVG